ncbi:MAG: acyl-CoA dehydrogenase family protein [Pseudomonadota bacterium]
MNFNHTEDRRMLSDTLLRFIADKYPFELRNAAAHSARGYNSEIWSQLAELGVIAALFSEDDGGFGGAGFDLAVVFDAVGRGLMVEPFLDSALLAGGTIAASGNEAQKTILDGIINATTLASFAHYERSGRYELAAVGTTAAQRGGGWTLNGTKSVVRFAEAADTFVMSARTSGTARDEDGISLFLVPAATEGLTVKGYTTVDGGRAAEVILDHVDLSQSALLGECGTGYPVIEKVIGRGIVALCAEAVGAMEVVRDATVEYMQTRKQFGVPLGKFQALQHRMAELLIEIEMARSAVINAAAALSKQRLERERALSAAKHTIGCIGQKVAEEVIQLHGGMGMTWELPLGHYAKRLVMIDHELGDEDHHLSRYIALGQTP